MLPQTQKGSWAGAPRQDFLSALPEEPSRQEKGKNALRQAVSGKQTSACPQESLGDQSHLPRPHLGQRGEEAGQRQEGLGRAHVDREALHAAATTFLSGSLLVTM